ncbi:MAG TPA: hypothetical protein DDX29_05855 [Clostridiales bacterium]|nr:hypothetical protein [Clostridiales bacterium]
MDKKKNEYLTAKQIQEMTGVKYSQLNYLVMEGHLKGHVIVRGPGRKREFHPEAINKIKSWLNKG